MVEGSREHAGRHIRMPQLSAGWRHFQELHGRRHGDFKDRRGGCCVASGSLAAVVDLGLLCLVP